MELVKGSKAAADEQGNQIAERVTNVEGAGLDKLVKEASPKVVFKFNTGDIEMPINTYNIGDVTIESISKIAPLGNSILVAEYGEVGMLQLLNELETKQGLKASAKLMVVGIASDCNRKFKLGSNVLLKSRDSYQVRPTYDYTNDFSFDKLMALAQSDKDLLAAVTISRNKDISRVGLRIESETIAPEVVDKISRNKAMGNLLYKDKILPFLNYKFVDSTNIEAVIYDDNIAE